MRWKSLRVLSLASFFLIWETICRLGLVNPLFLSSPSAILITILKLSMTGELFVHIWASLKRAFLGFFIGTAIAFPHGVLIAWFKSVEEISNPIVELFRPIPIAALIPVSILWFGIGDASKVAIIAFGCYFPVLLNTISGVESTDANHIKVAKLFGASRLQTLTKVILPSALPFIITGLRHALALSLILLVITEMIGARSGLGFLILDAEYTFKTERMFAGIVTIGLIGFALNEAVVRIEARLTRWRREIRAISF
jgi:NitT/TauT family transport system permease protein